MIAYYSKQGETLSFIAWQQYGHASGMVETLLEANKGLAATAILPTRTLVNLPKENKTHTLATTKKETINLWS